MLSTKFSEKEIYDLIADIPDPEIPVITIEDLGILREVKIEEGKVKIFITPTYSGCPAMKTIENDIIEILNKNEIDAFEIKTVFAPVWTTDWINDEAKEKLWQAMTEFANRDPGILSPVFEQRGRRDIAQQIERLVNQGHRGPSREEPGVGDRMRGAVRKSHVMGEGKFLVAVFEVRSEGDNLPVKLEWAAAALQA